ncbi:polyketide antibiotic transporter [Phycicoccus sp. BSK3Z-2]|uniref:Polyketide antibiotic transporter n=1 Tax=Phycicoccus avicenniae TaxID=2828860 RepID=A0A941DAS0_9MICO|nr:polyketide antibiotic transporter [Phycicoccus avicenniae]MBR7743552.1 polyketide antibiotic transporter [Phycicoccus avicenniae]
MSTLAGVGELTRLAWRRDRVLVPASVLGLAVLAAGSAAASLDLYPDDRSAAEGLAGVVSNPAVLAMYGPLASETADALAVFKTVMMGAVLTSVLALVVVRRHTRTEEEDGRLELLGSGAVGRRAPLAAAVGVAVVAVLLASGLAAVGLAAVGTDPGGSLAFGVAWATAGLAWTGITAVAVQVASTSRGAGGIAFGALGVAYLVRAAADTAPEGSGVHALGWLSPLGWAGRVEAYGADRTWLLLLGVGTLAVGTVAAAALLERRDLGGGLLPARPGPARGGRLLASPLGLVARLATGTLVGWTVGLVAGGVVVGSLLGSVGELADDPQVRRILETLGGSAGGVEDIFLATEVVVVAAVVSAAGVGLVLRLSAAERRGLAEPVLATPTPRSRWYLAHVLVGAALPVLLMAVLGLTVGLVGPTVSDAAPGPLEMLGATMSTLPAVWVLVGVAAALAGATPRFAPTAWGVALVAFVVGELGPTMRLPDPVVDLSPFAHLSGLPGGSFAAAEAVVLTVLAAVLVAAGGLAYDRRDLA